MDPNEALADAVVSITKAVAETMQQLHVGSMQTWRFLLCALFRTMDLFCCGTRHFCSITMSQSHDGQDSVV